MDLHDEEDTSDHICPECGTLTGNNRNTDRLCSKCELDSRFEESTGDWMIEYELQERVKHGIRCDELGYPYSEAFFWSVEEWEQINQKSWIEYISEKM